MRLNQSSSYGRWGEEVSNSWTIAMPIMPMPTLNASTRPTGISTDWNASKLSATGVKFCTERTAIAPIQVAAISEINKIGSVFMTLQTKSIVFLG